MFYIFVFFFFFFFFFQAEDGIRDGTVTGVQTCALPIFGVEHVMGVYVIWKFAENIDGAKKFLVDYIGNFHEAFVNSQFYEDRKSTRLNSSHSSISYAVFCLKKKKSKNYRM